MKTLLTFFVLLFSSSVLADDISDLQIEGMSIGDSLLDYYNEEEINSFRTYSYQNKEFYSMDLINTSLTFKIYDGMQVQIKTNDRSFIIHAISGALFFEDFEFNKCMNKLENIKKEILRLYTNYSKEEYHSSHPEDDDSKIYSYYMILNEGEISFQCTQWSKKYAKKQNLYHNLRVSVFTKDFSNWLQYKAY